MKTNKLIYPNSMIIVHNNPYRLIDVKSGAIYPINESSEKIMRHCNNPSTLDEIARMVGFKPNSVNMQKLTDFINKLLEANVLTHNKELSGKIFFKHAPSVPALEKIQFETTLKCNFSCKHCYNRSDSMGYEMDTNLVIDLVKKVHTMGVFKFDLTGGEFFARDDALDILDIMVQYGMVVNIFTNAYLINDIIIDKVKSMDNIRTFYISLDDCRPGSHDEMRNKKGAFMKTVLAIKGLKAIGKQVIVNCTVTKNTLPHMPEIYNYFINELGVKCRMSPLINIGRGENLKAINIDEFVGNIRSIGLKPEEVEGLFENSKHDVYTTHCGIGENMLFITASGIITPCPLLREDEFNLGNVLNDELTDIWPSNRILEEIRNATCDPNCQHKVKCKGGCKVRAYFDSGRFDGIDPVTCSLFIN